MASILNRNKQWLIYLNSTNGAFNRKMNTFSTLIWHINISSLLLLFISSGNECHFFSIFHKWNYSKTMKNSAEILWKNKKSCGFVSFDDIVLRIEILSPKINCLMVLIFCWLYPNPAWKKGISGIAYPQTCAAPPCRSFTVVLCLAVVKAFVPLNSSATWLCIFLHSWFLLCAARVFCSGMLGHALSQEPVGPHSSFALHFHVSSQLQLEAVELLQHRSCRLWYMDF